MIRFSFAAGHRKKTTPAQNTMYSPRAFNVSPNRFGGGQNELNHVSRLKVVVRDLRLSRCLVAEDQLFGFAVKGLKVETGMERNIQRGYVAEQPLAPGLRWVRLDTNRARPKAEIPMRNRFPKRFNFGAHSAPSKSAPMAPPAP